MVFQGRLVNLPTNAGHQNKALNSAVKVQDVQAKTKLHRGIQSRSRQVLLRYAYHLDGWNG